MNLICLYTKLNTCKINEKHIFFLLFQHLQQPKNLRGFSFYQKENIRVKHAKMLTSPVRFYSNSLPATSTYRINYFFFTNIMYTDHDMRFLPPPFLLKRISWSLDENHYRQTNMINLPYFIINSTRQKNVCNGVLVFVTFLINRRIKLNHK